MGKPRPRSAPAGKPPANGGKAGKLKKFKQPKQPRGEDGGGGGGGRRRPRSLWGLLGLAAGLASLYVYVVGGMRREKRARDRRILDSMLARPLKYTEHAACRMECRFIGKPEVVETLAKGSVNDRKSRPQLRPCPKYVVDANVGPAGKSVQAVFSACSDATNVVTVIDRDTNWACPPC